VVHRGGGDLVGQPHTLELLLGLDRAGAGEERDGVGRVAEPGEPGGREGGRLADHAVGGLGPEGELETHAFVFTGRRLRELERAGDRRAWVVGRVAGQEADVVRPGHALGVLCRGLEADQRGLALAREDGGLVALHAPEVGQVEDVVGRADDERVEPFLHHQRADVVELGVVSRPAHEEIVTLPARPRHPRVRRRPLR
jgi:hypothetical protein